MLEIIKANILFILIIFFLFFTNKIMTIKSKIFITLLILILQCILYSCDENICLGFLGSYLSFLIFLLFLKLLIRFSFYYSRKINEQKLKKILLYCVKNECYTKKFDSTIKKLLLFFLEQNKLYDNNYQFKDDDLKNTKIKNNKFEFEINYKKNIKKDENEFTLNYVNVLNIDPFQKPLCIKGKLTKTCENNDKKILYNCNNLEYEGNIKNFAYDDDDDDDKKKGNLKSKTKSIKKGKEFIVEGIFKDDNLENNRVIMNYNGMEFEGFLENEKLRIINNNNLNLTDNDEEYKKDYIKDDNWITIDEK
jgi:hypothetical protein